MVATATRHATHRPLVVLAGWLGSQPKSLRRYEELYERQGFQVVSRIARPLMVVRSVLSAESDAAWTPSPSSSWPHKVILPPSSMQELAWEVLAVAHHSQSPIIFFHTFSNGGCFLWEQIRRILELSGKGNHNLPEPILERLSDLRRRLSGVIFDSCPGADLHRLNEALGYCSWQERLEMTAKGGLDFLFIHRATVQTRIKERGQSYIHFLREDPWQVPQLYLYSDDDPLAPVEALNDVIEHRKRIIGKDRIWSRSWTSSPHCCHLLKHPEEYTMAVEAFVTACLQGNAESRL
jgi:pimeloyl-ACP methyl ester carboxylesterase